MSIAAFATLTGNIQELTAGVAALNVKINTATHIRKIHALTVKIRAVTVKIRELTVIIRALTATVPENIKLMKNYVSRLHRYIKHKTYTLKLKRNNSKRRNLKRQYILLVRTNKLYIWYKKQYKKMFNKKISYNTKRTIQMSFFCNKLITDKKIKYIALN